MSLTNRYFIELAYLGTAYHGWQTQPNAIGVQQKIDEALSTYFRENVETLGCGRTDTGVHASQFYAHFDLQAPFSVEQEQKFLKAVNSLLPYDIAIHHIHSVAPEAHARFDAVRRSYAYHIHFQKDPFKTQTSWLIREVLDIDAMNTAASYILEYDDFGCFCKANADNFTNICQVSRSEWEQHESGITYHVTANRFLRNMVRAIVGTLVDIGKGKMSPEHIKEIIESGSRSNAGPSVPACGLFLTEVYYPYIHQPSEESTHG